MNAEVRRERERCVSICRRRAAMWERAAALGEARARANEAAYLADLLESGADLDVTIPSGDEADV